MMMMMMMDDDEYLLCTDIITRYICMSSGSIYMIGSKLAGWRHFTLPEVYIFIITYNEKGAI